MWFLLAASITLCTGLVAVFVFLSFQTGIIRIDTLNGLNQEKIRGQRGTLPDQALGYVKFGKVIFRRPFATEV